MANDAEQTARNAERTLTNTPGMCLQQCRIWADIGAKYPDATTAARNATDMHRDRSVPRGAMAYWSGGSSGHGHIAVGLGNGLVRSTDADGTGRCATRALAWFDQNWPSLRYVGWADNVNGVTIPEVGDEDDMQASDWIKMRELVAEEVAKNNDNVANHVWDKKLTVTTPTGDKVDKTTKQVIRETWQKITKKM